MKVYPSITTISKNGWQKKVKEVKKFGLKEVCIFPTAIRMRERKKLYKVLEDAGVEKIPLVHLRDDMGLAELVWLKNKFEVEVFNIHVGGEHPNLNDYGKYKKYIYAENSTGELPESRIKKYAGMCFDVAHLESDRLFGEVGAYKQMIGLLGKYKVGVAHISAIIPKKIWIKNVNAYDYASHDFRKLSEFDYLLGYKKYLPEILALELENNIEEQLQAKEYIEKMLRIK